MNGLPDYLSPSSESRQIRGLSIEEGYQPMLAVWLIDLMLISGHHLKMARSRRHWFSDDDDIAALTGLIIEECNDPDSKEPECRLNGKVIPMTAVAIGDELSKHADVQRQKVVHDEFNIFSNIDMLGDILGLNRADRAVLCFIVMLKVIPQFNASMRDIGVKLPLNRVAGLIARLTSNSESEVMTSLLPESVLRASGIIQINDYHGHIEDKFELLSGLAALLVQEHRSPESLSEKILNKCSPATLSEQDYPHLKLDTATLSSYLAAAMAAKEPGCNVLLHGIPGTGKTEFAKVLAASLGKDLYEVSFSDEDGAPIRGNARLRAYNLCQRILTNRSNALLMFDEIEDVFPSRGFFQMLIDDGDEPQGRGIAKAWVNRTLEQNSTPAIWITNDAGIDRAYLRRFDYSVRFSVPPVEVRMEIARHHLGQFNPPVEFLARIAANERYTPGQLDRAAKVARLGSPDDAQRAQELALQALERSASLLGQRTLPARNVQHTRYDTRFVNSSLPLERILEGLHKRRTGTFCFYGPAGTGKSEFARHIADRIGSPCLVRRASDILSMYVGGTEQNIAEMFAEARQQEAVLVLDEADSFLADRRDARHSWEVTQVNELLTQMEAFEGIFVCTTNLMDRLDQASLRRFAFKVKFDYLNADQRWEMFRQELHRLGGDPQLAGACEGQVRSIERLTPGDFAVAARQFALYGEPATAEGLLAQLKEECRVKGGSLGRMGF